VGPSCVFSLPFSGVVESSVSAVKVTNSGSGNSILGINSGTGTAGKFIIDNLSNNNAAASVRTNGGGTALSVYTTGTGTPGTFNIDNPENNSSALFAGTNGKGSAANFEVFSTDTNEGVPALHVHTVGRGPAVQGVMDGTHEAGSFMTTNPANTNSAVHASTTGLGGAGVFDTFNANSVVPSLLGNNNGSGPAVMGTTTGTGNAGNFFVNNSSNAAPALYVTTIGTGPAGQFDGNVNVNGNVHVNKNITFSDGTSMNSAPVATTFAICLSNLTAPRSCGCFNSLSETTTVNGPCTVTSTTGSCSGIVNMQGYYAVCCVCAP
jgi:hypothetical protein